MTFKADTKIAPSVVKAVLPDKYSVDDMQVAITGELAVSEKPEEKGLWLALKSGQKVLLANRKAKDDKDKVEDVVAKLDEALKAGTKAARVEGKLTEDKDGNLTLHLAKGEAVAEKKEEKK
ncbi:MAG: hypothetical protein FD180_1399 [Planctomycetota bacterium]|nr:MAG: hypothetical protein FD180_1399 [Planctomycetota bacterium]